MNIELGKRIIYCDSSCIIVNKIAGEAAEGAKAGMTDLPKQLLEISALPSANDALEFPAAVHRLDVPVTGCSVFARTKTALCFLNEKFKTNCVKKIYWAVVEKPDNDIINKINEKNTEFIHWIQFNAKQNKSIAFSEEGEGRKKAKLRCRLAGEGRDYLFMEIELITGRHHQIRAQFEHLGLHIKGDLKYGSRRSEKNGGIRLHARSITFPNPANPRKLIYAEAVPLPEDNLWLAFQEIQ